MVQGLQRVMVTAIIKRGNKYLLVKRSKKSKVFAGYWQFPEGGVRYGENVLDALGRELREELSVNLLSAKLLWVYTCLLERYGLPLQLIRIFYKCKVSGQIKLNNENDDYGWFSKSEISKLKLVPGYEWDELKEII